MPSRLVALLGAAGLVRLPPVVLLVRRVPDSLISYFFKERHIKGLGALDRYVARPPKAQGVDVWWFIRFFNRWGLLSRVFPTAVMVVRYEDVARDPETWVRRIWAHWGVEFSEADLTAAMAVSSREVVQTRSDPEYGEDIALARQSRHAVEYGDRDLALLQARFARHLRHDFGYDDVLTSPEPWRPAPVHEGIQATA